MPGVRGVAGAALRGLADRIEPTCPACGGLVLTASDGERACADPGCVNAHGFARVDRYPVLSSSVLDAVNDHYRRELADFFGVVDGADLSGCARRSAPMGSSSCR